MGTSASGKIWHSGADPNLRLENTGAEIGRELGVLDKLSACSVPRINALHAAVASLKAGRIRTHLASWNIGCPFETTSSKVAGILGSEGLQTNQGCSICRGIVPRGGKSC